MFPFWSACGSRWRRGCGRRTSSGALPCPPLPPGLTSLELSAYPDSQYEWCSVPDLCPTALAPLTRLLPHLALEDIMPPALAGGSSGWASLVGGLTALRSEPARCQA